VAPANNVGEKAARVKSKPIVSGHRVLAPVWYQRKKTVCQVTKGNREPYETSCGTKTPGAGASWTEARLQDLKRRRSHCSSLRPSPGVTMAPIARVHCPRPSRVPFGARCARRRARRRAGDWSPGGTRRASHLPAVPTFDGVSDIELAIVPRRKRDLEQATELTMGATIDGRPAKLLQGGAALIWVPAAAADRPG